MTYIDTEAQFRAPHCWLEGTAVYDLRDSTEGGETIAELVSFTCGEREIGRDALTEMLGDEAWRVARAEERVGAIHAPDPMGDAADRDFDRHYDGWAAQ